MATDKIQQMREWVEQLNQAADAYYNGQGELLTDYEWDARFDQLKRLEEELFCPIHPPIKFLPIISAGQKRRMSFQPFH